jgi:GntR family transcriptional regulator
MKIERGELAPRDALPPLHDLTEPWSCSLTSARNGSSLLKQQGLITGARGWPPTVRKVPDRAVCSSARYQAEKDLVLASEEERRHHGEPLENLRLSFDQTQFKATFDVTSHGGHRSGTGDR